ncbi:MAG: BatA domain-containing protein, partial [Planctomycetes bacterium]|nr:BatA domain-containing protein [Planctomycetota bacterium]
MIGFASSAWLWALAAVAVPVGIHLLMRDRIQRVDFPTLRFFAKGAKTVLRKRRVDEALLLALRVLLIVMVVLACARPGAARPADADGTVARARVI